MSTFYLLPPRAVVGERFSQFLKNIFPGLEVGSSSWTQMGDALAALASQQNNIFVVHGEDLPQGEEPAQALVHGYGAECGDEVIEVIPGQTPLELIARRWEVNVG